MPVQNKSYRMMQLDRLLAVLEEKPQISLDDLSIKLHTDRSVIVRQIKQLEAMREIIRIKGYGQKPNRYVLTKNAVSV